MGTLQDYEVANVRCFIRGRAFGRAPPFRDRAQAERSEGPQSGHTKQAGMA